MIPVSDGNFSLSLAMGVVVVEKLVDGAGKQRYSYGGGKAGFQDSQYFVIGNATNNGGIMKSINKKMQEFNGQ